MMRQPSTFRALFAWHAAALAGQRPDRHEGDPQCGFYKRRMVRGGPWVPARIYVDREIDPETGELASDERLVLEVEGLVIGCPIDQWTYLTPISRREFDHLTDYRLRDNRMMDPYQKIDLSESPTSPQGIF